MSTPTQRRSPLLEKLGIPQPRAPNPKKELGVWTRDIRCRFSNEMEQRLLVFTKEAQVQYEKWRNLIASIADNECYWEGFSSEYHYGEFNFDNDMPIVKHYMVEFSDPEMFTLVYEGFKAHFPQKHRPDMRLKYITNEEFVTEPTMFPAPYHATGFAKEFRTRYDMEMEAVYNILPGFSTPVPDWRTIYNKLRRLMLSHNKQFGVDLLRKFGASSILDLQENNLDTEMYYHLNAACDWELNKWEEDHPNGNI